MQKINKILKKPKFESRFEVFVPPPPRDGDRLLQGVVESDLLIKLIRLGANPMLNAEYQPSKERVCSLKGFALLDNGNLIDCKDFQDGTVVCLQYYTNENITDLDLLTLKNASYWLYELENEMLPNYTFEQKQTLREKILETFHTQKKLCKIV